MKKLFLAGVLTAAMAISTSAFAAVSYGENDTLGVTYDPATNKVSVTTDLSTYNGQMTLLVLDKDASAITSDTILYIDQDAAPEAGAKIFQDMGLKMPADVTTLPAGTYPVKVGSDDASLTALLVGNIIVTEDAGGKEIKFIFGDVNNSGAADGIDALDILSYSVNSTLNKVGAFAMGDTLATKSGNTIIFGDVNSSGATDGIDALDILSYSVNSTLNKVGTYAIDEEVTVVVNE